MRKVQSSMFESRNNAFQSLLEWTKFLSRKDFFTISEVGIKYLGFTRWEYYHKNTDYSWKSKLFKLKTVETYLSMPNKYILLDFCGCGNRFGGNNCSTFLWLVLFWIGLIFYNILVDSAKNGACPWHICSHVDLN